VATISFTGDDGANLLQNARNGDRHDHLHRGRRDQLPTSPAVTVRTISFNRATAEPLHNANGDSTITYTRRVRRGRN